MPQNRYTNADLPRFARQPLGVTIEQQPPAAPEPYVPDQPSVEELLRQAHATLGRANQFSEGINRTNDPEDVQRTMNYDQSAPSVMDSTLERFGKLAKHYIATRPEAIEKIAPAAMMLGGPVGAVAGGIAGLSGAKNLYERGLEGVTEHPYLTAGDAAMVVGGVSPVLKGLKLAGKGVSSVVNTLNEGDKAKRAAQAAAEAEAQAGETVKGTVDYARGRMQDLRKGGTEANDAYKQAGKEAGWPLGKSKAVPINHSEATTATPISDIMSGNDSAYRRNPIVQGLMQALASNHKPFSNADLAGLGAGAPEPYVSGARQEIAALRSLLRQSIR